MTDQIQSSPVGAPDSSSENALAQWQELPLFLFRKRIKSLALLRYGDTSVRLSSPAVDYFCLHNIRLRVTRPTASRLPSSLKRRK